MPRTPITHMPTGGEREKLERFATRLPPHTAIAIKKAAKEDGATCSAVLRQILRHWAAGQRMESASGA